MTIWHKEVSTAIESVVDNPAIVHLYQRWVLAQAESAPSFPALALFDPRTVLLDLQANLMLLACEGDDLRYLHYGHEIQRHSQFNMTGKCVSEFGGELATYFRSCYDRVLQSRQPLYTIHSSVRVKSVFTWERLILPVVDAHGTPHLCVYNRPLETRAHILEVVLQTASDALLVLRTQDQHTDGDIDWVIVLANERFAALAGRPPQGLAGQSVVDVFPAWRTLGLEADCRAALTEGKGAGPRGEREVAVQMNGATRWFAIHVGAVPLGCVIRLADITAAKQQALDLQADNQRLAHWANMDGLTGIANRRAMDAFLEGELQRALRHDLPLCVVLCDIDLFKAYNDLHGHLKGDDCIRTVARLLADAAARPTDLVARYGGEEFVMVMPHTDLAGTMEVVGKVMQLLASQAMAHGASDVCPHVTLSFGIACRPEGAHVSMHDLLNQADQALYRAKRGGRNRYVVHG